MTLTPATLGEAPGGRAPGAPYAPYYDDFYGEPGGIWARARDVFLRGNGLPGRWQRRDRFVILEAGFGLGQNFLATWLAWRDDPARCDELIFISVEQHPLQAVDLAAAHAGQTGPAAELAARLQAAWPPLTPGWHLLDFDEACLPAGDSGRRPRVRLMLGLGDVSRLLPGLLAQADAFYLDGFAPDRNPAMWDERLLTRLNRLAAPEATLACWTHTPAIRDALAAAGFEVAITPGPGCCRDALSGHHAPRHVPRPPAGGLWHAPAPRHRHAVVVGAGLAGASAALALCEAGWRVTLLDRESGPAQATSGNPGGLFHSIVHGEDGVHARAHRAAVLALWQKAGDWLESGQVRGQPDGLLRLDPKTDEATARATLRRLGLPKDHVTWLTAEEAAHRCGVRVASGGWWFAQAGWLHPAGLAQAMLEAAAAGFPGALTVKFGAEAAALRRDEATGEWLAMSATGAALAQAPTLVLANALGAPTLLGTLPDELAVAVPPMSAVRGQITALALSAGLPRVPIAGSGYALALDEHTLLCGATSQHHDADPAVRGADHRHNLQQARRLGLSGLPSEEDGVDGLDGRVGWRAVTPDRLPVVGALPWAPARLADVPHLRADQVRQIPRQRDNAGGLYVMTGLGSRGIAWSVLAGRLLAHWVTGAPCPVEADLRDALDPARFLARAARGTGERQAPDGSS